MITSVVPYIYKLDGLTPEELKLRVQLAMFKGLDTADYGLMLKLLNRVNQEDGLDPTNLLFSNQQSQYLLSYLNHNPVIYG